jgi:hypothetical protein
MGNVLNTTKDRLVQLLNVTDSVPAGKLATDISKHLGFRKALKRHLKDYTDAKAESIDEVRTKHREMQKEVALLDLQLKTAADEDKAGLEAKKAELNRELSEFVEESNQKINASFEDLKLEKVEVTFDNEEFLFEKNVILDNASTIFKIGQDKFNADLAEVIYDLFDSVK